MRTAAVTRFDYDGANRPVGQSEGFGSPDATTTLSKLDRVGNVLEQKNGRVTGKTFDVRNTYDALNRLKTTEDGEGNVTQYEYDGGGNRTAQIEPESNRTEYAYGELNELIQVTAADGGVFTYAYDPNRNRIEQVDGAGRKVAMGYDKLNRMTSLRQDPDGFNYATTHEYDPNGNEIRMVDAKGQETKLEYDDLDRLKAKIYTLPPSEQDLFLRTHRIDYVEYDGNDNLKRIDETRSSGTDPPSVVTSRMEYDTLDRLTKETDTFARVLEYGYDNQGNRTSLLDPDRIPTTYGYDALNRLKRVTSEGRETTYQYFPDDLKKLVIQPNGTSSTFAYDAADRVTTITHTAGATPISSYGYTYFPNSNRKTQEETNAGRPHRNDALHVRSGEPCGDHHVSRLGRHVRL